MLHLLVDTSTVPWGKRRLWVWRQTGVESFHCLRSLLGATITSALGHTVLERALAHKVHLYLAWTTKLSCRAVHIYVNLPKFSFQLNYFTLFAGVVLKNLAQIQAFFASIGIFCSWITTPANFLWHGAFNAVSLKFTPFVAYTAPQTVIINQHPSCLPNFVKKLCTHPFHAKSAMSRW